jgi:hypothetical protein
VNVARVRSGIRPALKVPYDGALKAFAYAGMPFNTASRILDSLGFLQPPVGDNSLKTLYTFHRQSARDINPDFKFARGLAESFGINPIYEWVSRSKAHETTNARIDTIMDEMRQPLLRRALDILLYLGWSPEEVSEALNTKIDAPIRCWDVEDVTIYRDFFWNTELMGVSDWEQYLSWWQEAPMAYANNHVFSMLDSSREELLWMAGITEGITPQQMAKAMMMECYIQFRKNSSSSNPDSAMMLKHIDAFRKLAMTSKVLGGMDEESRGAASDIMQSISVSFKAPGAREPISRVELEDGPVTITSREAITLNEDESDATS